MEKLVVVGASAGGLEALLRLVADLPEDLPAAMLVVIHFPPHGTSRLAEILARRTRLSVDQATHGEGLMVGTIRVARPNHHLAVRDGRVSVTRGPRENRHRPSIDVLFRSAADRDGHRAIGVVLSGGPGDGQEGVRAMAHAGASILVQDPDEALFASLPESAMEVAPSALVVPSALLAQHLLESLEAVPAARAGDTEGPPPAAEEPMATREGGTGREEVKAVDIDDDHRGREDGDWHPVPYSCPDCNGTLWEQRDGALLRFRCRIGHRYGADGLLEAKSEELEAALWSAVNTMEERAELSERMARRAGSSGSSAAERRFERTAAELRRHADWIRERLLEVRED